MIKRKFVKVIMGVVVVLLIMVIINFIPTWNMRTKHMSVLEGKWLNVYYETEKDAAQDVFELADAKAEEITKKLGFQTKQDVAIYIYDSQSTMQTKKYGYFAPLLGLDWYIGDNIDTDVILTSPAHPGKAHDYDDNKNAALHEMVHAYVSIINPHIRLWLTEGMALYLTNGYPFYKDYLNDMKIPSYSDMKTSNPVKFAKIGGYNFANTYIEYLDKTYGWDKVLDLIRTQKYQQVFGKTETEIYTEWVYFLENYYQ